MKQTRKIRENHRLSVFGKSVRRNILGPERDDVKGGLRKFLEVELHDLCSSQDIIKVIKWSEMCGAGSTCELKILAVGSTGSNGMVSSVVLITFNITHVTALNFLKPTGHVKYQQFNIQQLYVLPTLYLCVLYLSENKQRLVPLTA